MDQISQSIIAALSTGITIGRVEANPNPAAIKAYETLKTALSRKFGSDSELFDAVAKLEQKPESHARQEVLREEMAAAEANQDSELLAFSEILLEKLKPTATRPLRLLPVLVPLQRPAQASHFVDREAEVAQLLPHLQPGQAVILCGPGGIGKTAVATAALWRLAPQATPPQTFPDGIIYHDFYNQPRVDIALDQMVRAFGQEPTPTAYDAAERVLVERRALLVLDGVEQADDLPGLLAVRGGCGVLMASRREPNLPDIEPIRVNITALPAEHAVALLQTWSEVPLPDMGLNGRICELLGCSPLAIRLAGHYLAASHEAPPAFLAWLETTALPQLDPGQRQAESVSLLIAHNLAQVSELARQVLGVAGLLAMVPFDERAVIKALSNEAGHGLLSTIKGIFKHKTDELKPSVIPAIRELVNYGLLWWNGQHPEISHSLMHAYARQQLPPTPRTVKLLALYYTSLAWEQNALGVEGYLRLDADRLHFMRVLNECLEREEWEAAHGLAAAIEDYLDRQGYWIERVIANEAGLVAAWQLGRPSEGAWLGNLGDTYRTMGHAKWAIEHFKKALETARRSGDPYSEANSLGNLGLAYRDLGQIDQARSYLQQSFAIFDRVNSPSADLVQDWLRELESWREE
jgi:tetratricopeptide (TPR) repeat protein